MNILLEDIISTNPVMADESSITITPAADHTTVRDDNLDNSEYIPILGIDDKPSIYLNDKPTSMIVNYPSVYPSVVLNNRPNSKTLEESKQDIHDIIKKNNLPDNVLTVEDFDTVVANNADLSGTGLTILNKDSTELKNTSSSSLIHEEKEEADEAFREAFLGPKGNLPELPVELKALDLALKEKPKTLNEDQYYIRAIMCLSNFTLNYNDVTRNYLGEAMVALGLYLRHGNKPECKRFCTQNLHYLSNILSRRLKAIKK